MPKIEDMSTNNIVNHFTGSMIKYISLGKNSGVNNATIDTKNSNPKKIYDDILIGFSYLLSLMYWHQAHAIKFAEAKYTGNIYVISFVLDDEKNSIVKMNAMKLKNKYFCVFVKLFISN